MSSIKLRSPVPYRFSEGRKYIIVNQPFGPSPLGFYKDGVHRGLDLRTKSVYEYLRDKTFFWRSREERMGTIPIVAAHDGFLTAGYNDDEVNGIYMKVKDGDWETLYFHLSSVRVWKDDEKMTGWEKIKGENFVKRGTVIGYGGNTGRFTTGAHLHFELRYKGEKVDPMPHFDDDIVYKYGNRYWYKGEEISYSKVKEIV